MFGEMGVIYWCAKKRGHDPQIPKYKNYVEHVRSYIEKHGDPVNK